MPRRLRLTLAGVAVHLIQPGINRVACFVADEDYARYLEHLAKFAPKFGCAVHAFVLMTNHVHLLLTPEQADGASQLMQRLGQHYVQYVNWTYQRSGTLWEGRFRSCLALCEDLVLACYRYIELNPVRAGMVCQPADYRWSSYRVNGQGTRSRLVVPHEEYLRLGTNATDRCEAYRALLKEQLDADVVTEIRDATNGNIALGNERFRTHIEAALGRRARHGKPGRPAASPKP
jgi:putative transposase